MHFIISFDTFTAKKYILVHGVISLNTLYCPMSTKGHVSRNLSPGLHTVQSLTINYKFSIINQEQLNKVYVSFLEVKYYNKTCVPCVIVLQ